MKIAKRNLDPLSQRERVGVREAKTSESYGVIMVRI